ncbi:APG6-domain-containing protein [Aaosphaeria arxii CBS 175.79]|uniref:APG6-domain-containing protein n=1 Tax=Aaosphaeria arxii CBS 175.79 TaxID=1450172 RepID=A0A6A5XK96_9PLEO|nr:APG6-domain-containing protein [Aaosphaeria arxii CBS 175.79]KAF2013299.1 APG6-domain-containing protein [Aaosphaeria arxii CBS 175.79]
MANDKTTASKLFCQKCRVPIDIDASVDQLNPAAFKLLTDSTVPGQQQSASSSTRQSRPAYPSARHQTYDAAIQNARNPTFKRNVPSPRFSQHGGHNPAMSFVNVHMSESMLDTPPPSTGSVRSPERQPVPEEGESNGTETTRRASAIGTSGASSAGKMSDGMETTNRMFEILSARSDIDHPICVECTELLVDGLQKRLTVATRERDAYVDYLRRANTDVPSAEEIKTAESQLKAAKKSEAEAIANLEKMEAEKAELDSQMAALEAEARELDKEEALFWRNRNKFATELSSFQNERDALTTKHAHDAQILTQLQRRSVYNDTFNITHDNHFATINGLRLGRLPSPYVDWPEINAAWGQTCLLVATLADRLGFKFEGYELCPMGSNSTILKLETKGTSNDRSGATSTQTGAAVTRQRLELYSSGDFPINFGFLHRKFDTAMVAFLECLRQLGEFVENSPAPAAHGSPGLGAIKMPYEIKKDKIHDQSIKLAMNKEELWTRACKYTLTCCKCLLAYANNVESLKVQRSR